MKKVTMIAVALCLAFALAIPAMAETTVDFSGYYRVRGWYYSDINLDDRPENIINNTGTDESQAYYDQRLRFTATINANDKVSVTTRWTAMNNVWGTNGYTDNAPGVNANAVENDQSVKGGDIYRPYLDYVYMTFVTGIGQFKIGQMPSGEWGYGVFDYEYAANKIAWGAPIGNFFVSAYIEKVSEGDGAYEARGLFSTNPGKVDSTDGVVDADADSYAVLAGYKSDTVNTAVIFAYGDNQVASENDQPKDQQIYGVSPYALLNFGPFSANIELTYGWGKNNFDKNAPIDAGSRPRNIAGGTTNVAQIIPSGRNVWNGASSAEFWTITTADVDGGPGAGTVIINRAANDTIKDRDIESFGFGMELAYNFGIGNVTGGYVYASGQDSSDEIKNGGDDTALNTMEGGIGGDYAPLLYLTSDGSVGLNYQRGLAQNSAQANIFNAAGQMGGISTEIANAGCELYFLRLEVTPMDNLKLWTVIGGAETTADRDLYTTYSVSDNRGIDKDEYANLDSGDDYGWEFDLGLEWKIMDNLTYTAQGAYVDLGDAWGELNYLLMYAANGAPGSAEVAAQWKDVDSSVYLLTHKIQVDF